MVKRLLFRDPLMILLADLICDMVRTVSNALHDATRYLLPSVSWNG